MDRSCAQVTYSKMEMETRGLQRVVCFQPKKEVDAGTGYSTLYYKNGFLKHSLVLVHK